jgi:putative ABC transport system substrate-binding protein
VVAAFAEGLQEAGLRRGPELAIEYHWADGQCERLTELAAAHTRRRVEVIVTGGAPRRARGKNSDFHNSDHGNFASSV